MAGKTRDLVDNFDSNTINVVKWTNASFTGGTATQAGGNLILIAATSTLNTGGEIDSVALFDLTGTYSLVKVVQVASQHCDTSLILQKDASNYLRMTKDAAGNLYSVYNNGGGEINVGFITYSSTTMQWWRIRESGGTIYFDYSANGIEWINLASVANPFVITALTQILQVFDASSDAAPGAAFFDNLNLPPHNYGFNVNKLRPRPFAPGLAR